MTAEIFGLHGARAAAFHFSRIAPISFWRGRLSWVGRDSNPEPNS